MKRFLTAIRVIPAPRFFCSAWLLPIDRYYAVPAVFVCVSPLLLLCFDVSF